MDEVIGVRPDPELKSRIRELESEYETRSAMLRDALRHGVKRLEADR